MPNTLSVPDPFPTIRAAITAAGEDDTIQIASGTYDIRNVFSTSDFIGPLTFSYTTSIDCMTGFDPINPILITQLNFVGAGSEFSVGTDATYVYGSPRLFVANQDGVPPVEISFDGMQLVYNNSQSNYILQTGNFGIPEDQTITKVIAINDVTFTGNHVGNMSANGNYSAVLGISSFGMSNCNVNLTGQHSFIGTQANSGGSSFIMAQGGLIGDGVSFAGNNFDESGYRNAVSVFDSAQAVLSNNTFYRSDPATRYRRNGSEKFKNTSGSVTSNRFFDGAYVTLEKDGTVNPSEKQVVVTGNTFAQFDPTLPLNPIINGGAVGIVLQGANADNALFQPALSTSGNEFYYVTPLVNPSTSIIQLGVNKIVNPVNNLVVSVNSIYTGGTGNDTITGGTNQSDFLTGGLGNDSINTGTGGTADFVLFNTPLNSATNVDTITNFNRTGGGAAVDRIILDRSIFKDISATYNSSTPSVIGAVNASNIQNGTSATPLNPNTRLIYQTTTGNLYYDQDGSGTTYGTTLFARIFSNAGTTPIPGIVGFSTSATLGNVNIGIF